MAIAKKRNKAGPRPFKSKRGSNHELASKASRTKATNSKPKDVNRA